VRSYLVIVPAVAVKMMFWVSVSPTEVRIWNESVGSVEIGLSIESVRLNCY
jgi:hypothetical protein